MPDRPNRNVVTRFAPSPTGYLHVGGARTALFNWAFARRHGGTFILRIEDTDAARSTAESTRRIIEDLVWLGLEWDEGPSRALAEFNDLYKEYDIYADQVGAQGPYFQSQRTDLYRGYLKKLEDAGRAYRCFRTQAELKAEREAQKAAGAPLKYNAAISRNLRATEVSQRVSAGDPYVWRFHMPDVDVTVHDLVLGDVTIKAEELEDFVIMKGDAAGGGPTFHFANVVDDATMEVTHVLRAQEHLMNTPKHVAMFDALGIARPKYAHMPLIFNPDGTKMSKRDKAKTARAAAKDWISKPGRKEDDLVDLLMKHREETSNPLSEAFAHPKPPPFEKATIRLFIEKKNDEPVVTDLIAAKLGIKLPEIDVHDFRQSGYLSEAILNYIALLGWNPGGNVPELFDRQWFVQNFSIDGIGKSNAKFDRVKLLAFNAETIAKLPFDEYCTRLREFMRRYGTASEWQSAAFGFNERQQSIVKIYQSRLRVLSDLSSMAAFFNEPGPSYDEKAVVKVLKSNNKAGQTVLRELAPVLEAVEPWTPEAIHNAIEKFAADTKRSMGDVAQPIRVAVSGTTVSPPIHDTLAILGKQSTINRLKRAAEL